MRIGILGGTFDPPHNGHLALGRSAMEHLALDEVLLVPANRNPDKHRRDTTSPQDRLEMAKRLIDGQQGFALSDLEVTRGGPSYTVDTLAELQMARPAEYWVILGADALGGFAHWKSPMRIVRLARLAVVARPPAPELGNLARLPEEFRPVVDIVPMPPVDLSSTSIRNRVQRGESIDPYTTQEVVRYIRERGLYKS